MAKILIADDAKNIRMLYRLELQDEGYEVLTTRDRHKLLNRIEQEHPDVIILGIGFAEYGGFDILSEIKNRFYGTPVIVCSTNHTCHGFMRFGPGVFYVQKSCNLSPLKQAVAQALESVTFLPYPSFSASHN
jgi:DNA-binding NtrC family response regulator